MDIPKYVQNIINKLEKAGFEAYIVGGCVRDLLMLRLAATNGGHANEERKEPKDWDITTNARPEEVLKVFPDGKYENNFGTVLVPFKDKISESKGMVEVTTYRSEQGYSDRRHPDEVVFEDSLEKDLSRRDFTINALAGKLPARRTYTDKAGGKVESRKLKGEDIEIIDLFGGEKDIKKKIIRAVGEPVPSD